MSKRTPYFTLSATAAAIFVMAAGPVAAQSDGRTNRVNSVPAALAENTNLWFVELAGKPVADGAQLSAVQAEKSSFRAAAQAARVSFTERRSYDTLFNGFSVEVTPAERTKLARLPGVKAMYRVETIAAPQVTSSDAQPDMVAALALTGANIAQNTLGLTGSGIRVGIIDTGIDTDHPGFGGSGTNGTTAFPSARIVAGHDFVGDTFNADPTSASYNPVPTPDANPDDCQGHGTHVAGIVGANGGGVLGVAPQVRFGAYRVFGCAGSTTADIILSALERALADGMQVINQSLGASRQWPQYPTAQATGRLAKKGVVMVASIGNSGPGGSQPDGLYAAGAPGTGDGVIGVASFDNAQRSFTAAGVPYGFITAGSAPVAPTTGSLPIVRIGPPAVPPATNGTDACSVLTPGSLTGQAVLVQRGTCGFYVKAFNAQTAGAAAVVLYNHSAGALNAGVVPAPAGSPAITIPVVGITLREGTVLNTAIANGPTSITWNSNYVGYPFGTGGLISGFSSFGLAADLSLKPNLGAPGGAILSTYPLEAGGTATLSGTSMSSPHVAGAAALILQALPNAALGSEGPIRGSRTAPPVNMQTRLQNHAKPANWSTTPDSGELDHAFRQGAGMIDIVAAVQATTFVMPSQISLGESETGPVTTRMTVRNTGANPVTFNLSHRAARAAGPNNTASATLAATPAVTFNLSATFNSPAVVSFSNPTVTVPARGTATFQVTIDANAALVNRGLYGGYVTLTPQAGGNVLSVPFAGLKGDYQSTVVLTSGGISNFPWLGKSAGTAVNSCPSGCSYTLSPAAGTTPADVPLVVAHLDHLSRQIRVEAIDATTNVSVGVVSVEDYASRNSSQQGFFTFPWNGVTDLVPAGVPNGTYRLRMSVLKALGDPANPAHWEIFNSPVATVARP